MARVVAPMKIIAHRTRIPSDILRRAAYDRLVPQGSDSGYLHWLQQRRIEFMRLHPGIKEGEFHRAFDRWLEKLK